MPGYSRRNTASKSSSDSGYTSSTRDTPREPLIVGLFLLAWGLSEVWFRVFRRPQPATWTTVAFPLTLVAVGAVIILEPGPGLPSLIGLALMLRGLVFLFEAVRARTRGEETSDIIRALVLIAVGAVTLAIPETAVLGLRGIIGGGAVLLGGILIARGLSEDDPAEILEIDTAGAGRLATEWLHGQRLEDDQSNEISDGLFFEPPKRGAKLASFWVMMCLATAIAAFAVIQDSTAVVIGAMLVAPLMTPIMGIAAGMVNGWPTRMVASLLLVIATVIVAILLAWVLAAWLPSVGDLAINGQVTSRTSPSLLDLCIAVAAGAAGAFATIDPRVSSSLSGVAIAVALVPPLAVVGITLEAGMGDEALGAFLLFLTNFVSIVLAGGVVFLLTGYAVFPRAEEDSRRGWRILGPVMVGAVVILVPLSLTSFSAWEDSANDQKARAEIDVWLGTERDLAMVQLDVENEEVDLVLTGEDEPPGVDDLEDTLSESFGEDVALTVRVVPSVVYTD